MKKSLRLFAFVFLLFITASCGCRSGYSESEISENQIISEMKAHLSDKYGIIEYDIEGFIPAGWDRNCDLLNLKTNFNGTEYNFSVERHKDGETVSFQDNYFGILVKEEFEEKLYVCASKYFDNCFTDIASMSINYPNELKKGSGFSDLKELKDSISSKITAVTVVDETFDSIGEFEKAAENFCDDWNKNEIPVMHRVIYVSHETFMQINQSNFREQGVLSDNRIAEFTKL